MESRQGQDLTWQEVVKTANSVGRLANSTETMNYINGLKSGSISDWYAISDLPNTWLSGGGVEARGNTKTTEDGLPPTGKSVDNDDERDYKWLVNFVVVKK